MKNKVIRLTESDLMKIVKKVIKEQEHGKGAMIDNPIIKKARELNIVSGRWGLSKDGSKVVFTTDEGGSLRSPTLLGTVPAPFLDVPQGEKTGNWRIVGSQLVLKKPTERILMTKEYPTSLGTVKVASAVFVPADKTVSVVGELNGKQAEFIFDCTTKKFKTNLQSNGGLEKMVSQFCKV